LVIIIITAIINHLSSFSNIIQLNGYCVGALFVNRLPDGNATGMRREWPGYISGSRDSESLGLIELTI